MKVSELIKLLESVPPHYEVLTHSEGDEQFSEAEEVRLDADHYAIIWGS